MAATLIGLSGTIVSSAQTEQEVSDLVAEALLLPDWHVVATANIGGGFKDNVFLSHADPQGSPFVAASADVFVLRQALDGPRFSFLADADGRYYFEVAHEEYTGFAQASFEQDFSDVWTGALAAHYFYQDQVLDVSTSETNREAIPVLGHTVNARPRLTALLPGDNQVDLEGIATRQFFDTPLDNYWENGLKLTASHHYGRDSQVAISYEPLWRPYDTDPALTASGDAITNSHRVSFRQEARATWRHHWDEEKQWRTILTAGVRVNQENGGGYFDYTRWFVAGRLRYRARGWEITGEGRFANYDYHNQTVSATDPFKRNRTEWIAAVGIERQLARHLALLIRYEYETIWSNDPLETYSVNTVSGSLSWEF